MKKRNKGFVLLDLILAVLWIVGTVGYIWNIIRMVGYIGEPLSVEFALRAVGVFLAPLGAVLGYIPF